MTIPSSIHRLSKDGTDQRRRPAEIEIRRTHKPRVLRPSLLSVATAWWVALSVVGWPGVCRFATAGETMKPFADVTDAKGLKGAGGEKAAWGDYDNDGWVDLCVNGFIFHNEQGRRFVRVAQVEGPALWGDYDNDGFLDLFAYTSGKLYHNVAEAGGRQFRNVPFPTLPMRVSRGATWGDFDGDGFVDLYVGGYEYPDGGSPLASVVFRNKGDGTFVETWRTPPDPQPTRGVTAADFNEDGHIDVFASNYRLQPNNLWLNDGKGGLTNAAKAFNVEGNTKLGCYGHTIGSAWGDLDNDGHLDLFVGNFSHPPDYQDRSQFMRNMGPGGSYHFEDMSKTANLRWQESYASPALGDFDNDGYLDLYFTTVYPGDLSVLYRNLGKWRFEEMKDAAGLALPQTYQAAWADFDNDGCLDLMTGERLFRNTAGGNHWLKVTLKGNGRTSNTAAIGAQVRIKRGEQVLTRQVEGGTGEGNQNDLTLHFGLGAGAEDVELEVRWPDGRRQTEKSAVDRHLHFTQAAP